MDAEKKRNKIELDILRIIKEKLEKGEMNAERATKIAQLVLKTLHPGISLEDIYKVVPGLDDQFTELSGAVLPILQEYEDKVEKIVREKVESLIKQGHFTEAAQLEQQFTQGNIPIPVIKK